MGRNSLVISDALLNEAAALYQQGGAAAAGRFLRSRGIPIGDEAVRSRMRYRGYTSGVRPVWTEAELDFLEENYPDLLIPISAIAKQLNRSEIAVRVQAHELGIQRGVPTSSKPSARLVVPEFTVDKPVLIIADAHVPYHDAEWIDRMLELAMWWGCERGILLGDFIDAQHLSEKYEVHQRDAFADEAAEARPVLRQLLKAIPRWEWTLGNHEDRAGRIMKWKIPLYEFLQRYFVEDHERVRVYDSYAAWVGTKKHGRQWRLEHPKSHGAMVGVDLAVHHGANTAVAHTHHTSMARDPSDRYWGIRVGAAADHDRMRYCTRITNGKWKMSQGGLILVPGTDGILRPWTLTPDMDLAAMQRMYKGARRNIPRRV